MEEDFADLVTEIAAELGEQGVLSAEAAESVPEEAASIADMRGIDMDGIFLEQQSEDAPSVDDINISGVEESTLISVSENIKELERHAAANLAHSIQNSWSIS